MLSVSIEISFTFTLSPIDSYMCKKPVKFYAYGGGEGEII